MSIHCNHVRECLCETSAHTMDDRVSFAEMAEDFLIYKNTALYSIFRACTMLKQYANKDGKFIGMAEAAQRRYPCSLE